MALAAFDDGSIVVGGFFWWKTRGSVIEVRTVVVTSGESSGKADRTLLNASGYVLARCNATVSSKVTGKAVEVLVEEGMRVDEGQVLARIDASNVDTSLRLADANLEANPRALGETRSQRSLVRDCRPIRSRAMAIWFTADPHFGHATINRHCERPCASVAQMDEELLRNINDRVSPEDTLYHLGDFAFRTKSP